MIIFGYFCVTLLSYWRVLAQTSKNNHHISSSLMQFIGKNLAKASHPAHASVPSGGNCWPINQPQHPGRRLSGSELLVITTHTWEWRDRALLCSGRQVTRLAMRGTSEWPDRLTRSGHTSSVFLHFFHHLVSSEYNTDWN